MESLARFRGLRRLAAEILAVADAESPRQELELHLQVTAFLARTVPAAPPAVPHEEPPEAVRYCVVVVEAICPITCSTSSFSLTCSGWTDDHSRSMSGTIFRHPFSQAIAMQSV